MSASTASDFARLMGPVALALLGEPPEKHHDGLEWRYGTRGSLCIRVDKGTYYDNEAGVGGGTLDLLQRRGNLDKPGALEWMRDRKLIEATGPKPKPRIVAAYDYRDAAGALAFQVVRFDPKDFRQRRPDGKGGWAWDMRGVVRAPYRLPELIDAIVAGETIFVAEGEKGVDAIVAAGLAATCSPGGAGKWRPEYSALFAGAHVVVLADNDEPGRLHAADVLRHLRGVAGSIHVINLPGLAEKQDVADWLVSGRTAEDLIALIPPDGPPAHEEPPPPEPPLGDWADGDWTPPPEAENPGTTRPGPASSRRIEVLTPAQISEETARPYLVKGLIARGDFAILMGQPGSGKSVLAPHLAYAVAQGRTVLGRRVRQGPVLYLAAEDGHGMKNRVRALLRRYGDAPDFHLVPVALDLMTDGWQWQELLQLVTAIRPALIVDDTIAHSFPGLRENEGEDMGRVVKRMRALTSICNSAALGVHHVAKDNGTTPRGHGSLAADADITMLIEGTGRDARSIKLGKNRNGPSDVTFAFQIEVDQLGTDEDGDPITAPVAAEADAATVRPTREDKLPAKMAVLLRVLRSVDARYLEPVQPTPDMPIVTAIGREFLRAALIAAGWFPEGHIATTPDGSTKLAKSGYATENNALTSLKCKGFVGFNREWIWLL